jgi:hypothetical protein
MKTFIWGLFALLLAEVGASVAPSASRAPAPAPAPSPSLSPLSILLTNDSFEAALSPWSMYLNNSAIGTFLRDSSSAALGFIRQFGVGAADGATAGDTGAADDLASGLSKGGNAAKTLGTEIANAFNSLDARVAALEDGTTPTPPVSEYGKITGFTTGLNDAVFQLDGMEAHPENASKSWSLQKLDDYSLRFEVRSGDKWHWDPAGGPEERNEVSMGAADPLFFNLGEWFNFEYWLTYLPGPTNTAGWVTLTQTHSTANVSPIYNPFVVSLQQNTDKLQIVLQYTGQSGNNCVYTGPSALVRGQAYHLKARMKFGLSNDGVVQVWLDDKQIVNFTGNVGASTGFFYPKFGFYRGAAKETSAVVFKNVHFWKG